MRNLKRVLALAMAMVMILGMMVIGSSAASYTDEAAINEDYAVAVEVLTDMGVFKGTGAGFAPKATLSRAEAAALIYRVITSDVKDSKIDLYDYSSFEDVAEGAWYTSYVTYAANGGYIKGDGTGNFLPNAKVTGIQVLAIMLRAMGYGQKGEFEGAAWKDNVLTTADDLGILDNVAEDDLDKAASRELVAQLLWDAINADTTTYTPAFGYYPSTVSLGEKKFGLAEAEKVDDWGRPYTGWTYKTGAKATWYENDHVSYYTAQTECTLAVDLEIKTGAYVPVWTNGVEDKTVYINALDMRTRIGGQGTQMYVYEDRIVLIETYLAQVQTVVPEKADFNGHVYQEAANGLYVYGYTNGASTTKVAPTATPNYSIKGNTYAKGDMILISINAADAKVYIDNGLAASIAGTQTIIHTNAAQHTVNGTTYSDAVKLQLNEAGTEITNHTWYFDQYGNIIGVTDIATVYAYGVIEAIQWINPVFADGYAKATIRYMDGTTADAVIASIDNKPTAYAGDKGVGKINNANVAVSTDFTNNGDLLAKHLYKIGTNPDSTLALTEVTTKANVAIEAGDAYVAAGLVVNDNTQFLVRSTTPTGYVFTAISGYRNIGAYVQNEIDYVDKNRDGISEYVYIIGDAADAVTSNLFYLTSTNYTYTLLKDNTAVDYYTLTGYVDGVLGSIKVKGINASVVTDMLAAGPNSMFVVTTSNGYVTAIEHTANAFSWALSQMANTNRAYTGMSVVELTGAAGDIVSAGVYKDADVNMYYNMAVNTPVIGEWSADMSNKVVTLVWKNGVDANSRDVVAAYIVDKGLTVTDPTVEPLDATVKYEVLVYDDGQLLTTLESTWTGAAGTYAGQDFASVVSKWPGFTATSYEVVLDNSTVTVAAGETVTLTYIIDLKDVSANP